MPLVDPRSTSTYSRPSWRTSACTRLTLGSGTTMSQSRLRPMVVTFWVMRNGCPDTYRVTCSRTSPAARACSGESTCVPLTAASASLGNGSDGAGGSTGAGSSAGAATCSASGASAAGTAAAASVPGLPGSTMRQAIPNSPGRRSESVSRRMRGIESSDSPSLRAWASRYEPSSRTSADS